MMLRTPLVTGIAFAAGGIAWLVPPHVMGKITQVHPNTTWIENTLFHYIPSATIPSIEFCLRTFKRFSGVRNAS